MLQAANWSSKPTFKNFYHHPVMESTDKSAFGRVILSSSETSIYMLIYVKTEPFTM